MRRTTPVTTKAPTFSSDDYKTAILSEFRGIDESVNPFNVVKNSAKEINNLYLDDEGTMVTRPRLEYVQKLSRVGVYFNTFKIFDKDKKWIWIMVYTKPYMIYVKVDENSPFVEYSLETTSAPYLYEMDSFGAIFDNEKNKYLIGSVGNVSKLYVVELNFTTKTMKLTPADAYIPTTKNYDISTDTEYTFEQANLWSPEVKWAAYWNPEYFNDAAFRERKYVVADNKYYSKMFDCRYEGYTFTDYITDFTNNSVTCLWYKKNANSTWSAIMEYMEMSGDFKHVKTVLNNLNSTDPPSSTCYDKNDNVFYLMCYRDYTQSTLYTKVRLLKISETGEILFNTEYGVSETTGNNVKSRKNLIMIKDDKVTFGIGYTDNVTKKVLSLSITYDKDTMTNQKIYRSTEGIPWAYAFNSYHYCYDSKIDEYYGTGFKGYLIRVSATTAGFPSDTDYETKDYGIRDLIIYDNYRYFYNSFDGQIGSKGLIRFDNGTLSYYSDNRNVLTKPTLMRCYNDNLWVKLKEANEVKWIWYGILNSDAVPSKTVPFTDEDNQYTEVIPFKNQSIMVKTDNGCVLYKFDETSPKPLLFFAVNSAVDKPGHINRVDRYNNNFVFWSTETNTVYFTKNNDPTYIPEAYYDRYGGADGVKSVMRISDEYLAVLKENDTFLTWTSNDLFYSNELRTHTGSSKTDSSIVCNYSNLPIMINEDGVWSLGQSSSVNYQDTIYSSMTDQIDKSFTSISPDKYYLHNHKYYTYIGENNGDDCIMWVFDNRVGMWYKWTLPIRIAGFIEIDDVTYVVNDYGDRLYKLEINSKRLYPELDDTSYVDEIWSASTDSLYYRNIDWKWVSQPIYLNTLNYKKRMRYLKLIFANKYESDHITFKYWFKTYTQTEYPTNPKTYTAAIASLKTQKFRPHIPKFDFLQIILESNNSSDEFEDGEGNVVPTTLNDKIGFVSIALNYILLEG